MGVVQTVLVAASEANKLIMNTKTQICTWDLLTLFDIIISSYLHG